MKKLILLALLAFPALSQQRNAAQLGEDLKKLKVLGSVLHVAAHPDDESTHMLTWFAQQQHWETNYFACTRGDGGQNLIGDEQGVPLGLIRTQELLAARRIDGANQYFSRAFDFGFSKSTDEALGFWDKNLILSDLVWVIRKTRPDIIFTRFPPDARAGHGHHSASSALAIEAYKAAADPNMFPEQLKQGVDVWQAKRLLWNTFRFPGSSGNSTISDSQFKVDIGDFLPFLGQSTGELAAYSRSQHKSQGFGFAVDRGRSTEYFATLGGDAPKEFLWDGVDATWNRVNPSIEALINPIITAYNSEKPYASIPALIGLKK
ncbi:MAG: PIG-L family deacetylase, partial [Cytophagales bacterium]|nr:PIG-L family deacetylase [Cytophagales bacterium]